MQDGDLRSELPSSTASSSQCMAQTRPCYPKEAGPTFRLVPDDPGHPRHDGRSFIAAVLRQVMRRCALASSGASQPTVPECIQLESELNERPLPKWQIGCWIGNWGGEQYPPVKGVSRPPDSWVCLDLIKNSGALILICSLSRLQRINRHEQCN